MKSKKQLRTEIGDRREHLDFQWLETASSQIIERFQSLEVIQSSETIALYKAIEGEVDLESLFSKCWDLEKRTCIPVFNQATRVYEMAEITADTQFTTGHYGIMEPVSPSIITKSDIDLIAVPGVGFDPAGNRLGRGGGYYDRILDGFYGISIGIAFEFQIFSNIPHESHDKPVQGIVTETKFIKG